MSVKDIKAEELRTMKGRAGIVFQGCGGDPQEWIDGVNEELKKDNILLEGTEFKDISRFEHEGRTCLLFEYGNDVKVDDGKLAIWRIKFSQLEGMWLGDFVDNRLGGFTEQSEKVNEKAKPDCPLIGQDGNVFTLIGIASRTLKRNGMREEAEELQERAMSSGSYGEVLNIIGEYVNITSEDEMDEGMEMIM